MNITCENSTYVDHFENFSRIIPSCDMTPRFLIDIRRLWDELSCFSSRKIVVHWGADQQFLISMSLRLDTFRSQKTVFVAVSTLKTSKTLHTVTFIMRNSQFSVSKATLCHNMSSLDINTPPMFWFLVTTAHKFKLSSYHKLIFIFGQKWGYFIDLNRRCFNSFVRYSEYSSTKAAPIQFCCFFVRF